nr:tyrosine-type recombinase/integrase [Ancylobacter sp. Lp-2]
MRLGEIVTLKVADVAEKDGVKCFVLRREVDRRLKTPGAERVVPVHPELIRLGILRHAEAMKAKGAEGLFPDLPGEGQDQIADVFQKRFAYWSKTTLGVNAPGTSFHSFRHGFRDALREAGSPIDATRALGGWARSGGVEERYGQGTRPKTLAEVMARVKFEGVDLSHLKPI